MKIKHYDIVQKPGLAWYKYLRHGCTETVKDALKRETVSASHRGCISEREFEVDCFLSILADIDKPHINLIEAGAGWGEWCMALAGVIHNKIMPVTAETYFTIGIEGDRGYYLEMVRNFFRLNMSAISFWAAVSDTDGECRFNDGFKKQCGGSMSYQGTFKGSKLAARALGLINLISLKGNTIPQYKVDTLVESYKISPVDILHIDVQGAELLVLEGAKNIILNNQLDYAMVGTHAMSLHESVKLMLASRYEIVAEAIPGKQNNCYDYLPVWIEPGQDGMLIFKRRGLK